MSHVWDRFDWDASYHPALTGTFFGSKTLRALRLNIPWDLNGLTSLRSLHSLDIDMYTVASFPGLRQLLGPSSRLTTLVIRSFLPEVVDVPQACIEAPTIRSLAIDFCVPFYYHIASSGFEAFTEAFTMRNLEYLEIVGGFTGSVNEDVRVRVPEDWEAPLFPHLRTLRLEEVGFGLGASALIQSFSHNVTRLDLICTSGNHHLLSPPGADAPWPFLCSLTVETCDQVVDPDWLSAFLGRPRPAYANIRPHASLPVCQRYPPLSRSRHLLAE
ncbi:hypothetical protein B0H10DRAFT_978890 [Mycena sp. CBHHK59/15]|nr:hypothetical protein B0H10DRAFT_978890 [Mycena sp. CBHHK59/15]